MIVLSPETQNVLRFHRKGEPLFSSAGAAETFDRTYNRGRFKVLPVLGRTRTYVAHDSGSPLGQGTRGVYETPEQASARCEELHKAALARGEKSEPERHGYKNDWGDPRTWERL